MKNRVSKEVLEVYQKESPSAVDIENQDACEKFFAAQKELWQNRLKIPLRSLAGAKILDFGCGTGEIDIFLAKNKAEVTGADFNSKSIARARHLARVFSFSRKLAFKVNDIHTPLFPDGCADFTISLGVLPHVSDPEKVFKNMVDTCKDGGFIVVGFLEELGIVQRLLHRSIIRAIAGFDEEKIIKIARQAFPDHINRSVKYGLRTERSVIFDYLVNRHMYGLPLERVLDWFAQNKISYYSSWPSIDMPFQINPYASQKIPLAHPLLSEYRALLRLRWLFTQREDAHVFGRIAGILNSKLLVRQVDALSLALRNLVQKQEKIWSQGDLRNIQEIHHGIKNALATDTKRIWKLLNNELAKKTSALHKTLKEITRLQHKKSEHFNSCVELFRELNGLGTLYLSGIKCKVVKK